MVTSSGNNPFAYKRSFHTRSVKQEIKLNTENNNFETVENITRKKVHWGNLTGADVP